jgi:hypothetical protein
LIASYDYAINHQPKGTAVVEQHWPINEDPNPLINAENPVGLQKYTATADVSDPGVYLVSRRNVHGLDGQRKARMPSALRLNKGRFGAGDDSGTGGAGCAGRNEGHFPLLSFSP